MFQFKIRGYVDSQNMIWIVEDGLKNYMQTKGTKRLHLAKFARSRKLRCTSDKPEPT
jgi:hypothetical protein